MKPIISIKYRVVSMVLACSIMFSNMTIPVYASNDAMIETNAEISSTEEALDDSQQAKETEDEEDPSMEEEELQDEILFDEQSNDIDLSYDGNLVATPSNATPSEIPKESINTLETKNQLGLTVNESFAYGIQNTGNIDGILGAKLVLTLTGISSDDLKVEEMTNDSTELKELTGYVDGQEVTYYLDTVALKVGTQAEYDISLKSDAKQTYSIKGTFFARAIDENVTDNVTSQYIFEDTTNITSNILRSDESGNINPDIDHDGKIFTITFDSTGGSTVHPQEVKDGECIVEPDDPFKDGYNFLGWYYDGTIWDFMRGVDNHMTLTAKWEKERETYSVTFNSDGGSSVDTQVVEDGELAIEPPIPTKDDFIFLGWYHGSDLWDFNTNIVTSNIILTAKWKAKTYTVKFDTNGGTPVADQMVNNGGFITKPTNPIKDALIFEGWYLGDVPFDFNEPISEDITLTARWRDATTAIVLCRGPFYDTYGTNQTMGGSDSETVSVLGPYINTEAEYFKRSKTLPDNLSLTSDISLKKDGSIRTWYDSTDKTQYYYTAADYVGFYSGRAMFAGLPNLKEIDLSDWKSAWNPDLDCAGYLNNLGTCNLFGLDLRGMFAGDSSLEHMDMSHMDLSNAVDAVHMFNGCNEIKTINLGNLNSTGKLRHIGYAFYECKNLTNIIINDNILPEGYVDLSSWDTSNFGKSRTYISSTNKTITTYNTCPVDALFAGCESLKYVDISNWDLSNSCYLNYQEDVFSKPKAEYGTSSYMFYGCTGLEGVNLSNVNFGCFDYLDTTSMFYKCKNLKTIEFTNIKHTGKYLYANWMFAECTNIETLDLTGFRCEPYTQEENVTNVYGSNFSSMFKDCINLNNILYNEVFEHHTEFNAKKNNAGIPYEYSVYRGTSQMFLNCSANRPNWTDGIWAGGAYYPEGADKVENVKLIYQITFKDEENNLLFDPQYIPHNKLAEKPYVELNGKVPVWYNGDSIWEFSQDVVTSDLTLTAKWTDSVHITFDSQGGSVVNNQIIGLGELVVEPEKPNKYEYSFNGWYLGDKEYDFLHVYPTESITLTAKWDKIPVPENSAALLIQDGIIPKDTQCFKYSEALPESDVELLDLSSKDLHKPININDETVFTDELKFYVVGWYDKDTKTLYYHSDADFIIFKYDPYIYGNNPAGCYWIINNCNEIDFSKIRLESGKAKYLFGDPSSQKKNCENLEKVDLSGLSTDSLSDISYIFNGAPNLREVTFPKTNIELKNAYAAFLGCSELEYLDLSSFSTIENNIEKSKNAAEDADIFSPNLSRMFSGCKNLKTIIYSDRFEKPKCFKGFDGKTNRWNTNYMFFNCPANKPKWSEDDMYWLDSGSITVDYTNIFGGSYAEGIEQTVTFKAYTDETNTEVNATILDTKNCIVGEVLTPPENLEIPEGCELNYWEAQNTSKEAINLPGKYAKGSQTLVARWKTIEPKSDTGTNINAAINLKAVTFKQSPTRPDDSQTITDISISKDKSLLTWFDESNSTQYWWSESGYAKMNPNMDSLFANKTNLKEISLENLDFSNVKFMNNFFSGCKSLEKINFNGLVLENVTGLSSFAYNCSSLVSIDFGDSKYQSLSNLSQAFYNCTNLKSVSFKNFDANIKSLEKCFYNCTLLTELDLSGLSTENVISFISVFDSCSSLKSITYGETFVFPENLNVSTTTSSNKTYRMFYKCNSTLPKPDKWLEGAWRPDGSYYIGTITINLNGNYSGQTTQTVLHKYGKSLNESGTILPDMQRNDYVFDGWYTSSSLTTPIDKDELLTSNITYYAKWKRPGYTDTGSTVKTAINASATIFKQSITPPGSGISVTDISEMKDGSVVTWYDSSLTTQFWYSTTGIMHMNSDSSNLFNGKSKLKSINFDNMDFSEVKTVYRAFYGCSSLTDLDLSTINLNKIIDSSYLCYGCTGLKKINLGEWNTPINENMSYMFYNNSSLETIEVTKWNVPLNKNLSYLFYNCTNIESINMLGLKTENVVNMAYEFYKCSSLQNLDLSEYDTNNVTSYKSMFEGCTGLNYIKYGAEFKTKTGLTLSNSTSNVTYKMFSGCNTDLNKPTLWTDGNWNVTEGSYIVANMTVKFNTNYTGGGNLDNIIVKYGEPLSSVITELPTKDRGNGYILEGWYTSSGYTTKIGLDTIITANTTYYAKWERRGYSNTGSFIKAAINANAVSFVQSIEAPAPDISVKDISECSDFSIVTWYDSTSKIQYWYSTTGTMILNENSSSMFSGRSSLINISLRNIDASKVTTLYQFFYNCTKLQTIEFDEWNTENVTNMSYLFSGCSALNSLDLSSFNTNKVTTMAYMFNTCKSLETVIYGNNFNNTTVTSFTKMFYTCTANKPDWLGTWDSTGTFKK